MVAISLQLILLLASLIVFSISAFVASAGPVRLAPVGAALAVAAFLFGGMVVS